MTNRILGASALALALFGCSAGEAEKAATAAPTTETSATSTTSASIPESLAPFGDGYPKPGAPCRRLGESALTANYLDDSAILVGCPSDETAAMLNGRVVGNVEGVRLISIAITNASAGDQANANASSAAPKNTASAPKAKAVPIRGANSLESRCAQKVARETGARVVGTNRIEESEAAIGIFVNVEGAQAPWRCLAYRDGTIGEIMYTGSEGYL